MTSNLHRIVATFVGVTVVFAGLSICGPMAMAGVVFSKTRIEIPAARGYTAPANLYMPVAQSQARLPALLLQFGAEGDRNADYIVEIAEGMVAKGFVVLTMDMPGRGEREATSPEPSSNTDLGRWYMEDYAKGLDYLQSLPMVNPNRLSYGGTSLGAITGIPFCAKDQRVKACISIVGGGSSSSGLPRDVDCVQTVADISPRATMLMNGTLDPIIPYFYAQNLHSRVKAPFEKIWYQADHYLRGVDRADMFNRMTAFLNRYAP